MHGSYGEIKCIVHQCILYLLFEILYYKFCSFRIMNLCVTRFPCMEVEELRINEDLAIQMINNIDASLVFENIGARMVHFQPIII